MNKKLHIHFGARQRWDTSVEGLSGLIIKQGQVGSCLQWSQEVTTGTALSYRDHNVLQKVLLESFGNTGSHDSNDVLRNGGDHGINFLVNTWCNYRIHQVCQRS